MVTKLVSTKYIYDAVSGRLLLQIRLQHIVVTEIEKIRRSIVTSTETKPCDLLSGGIDPADFAGFESFNISIIYLRISVST